jgi:hypothetical protein
LLEDFEKLKKKYSPLENEDIESKKNRRWWFFILWWNSKRIINKKWKRNFNE